MPKFILVTILMIVAFVTFLLLCPVFETYMGWNMPFVRINLQEFNVFGYEISDGNKQMGVVTLCGVLTMLPARVIHILMTELQKR